MIFGPILSRILAPVSLVLLLGFGIQTWRANHYHDLYKALHGQASVLLSALTQATGHKVEWKSAPGEAIALGEMVKAQRYAIDQTNARIDDMAREAVRLKARSDELRAIAERAQAQRKAALAKLGDLAATPGTRADCMALLQEADEALNIVREAAQ